MRNLELYFEKIFKKVRLPFYVASFLIVFGSLSVELLVSIFFLETLPGTATYFGHVSVFFAMIFMKKLRDKAVQMLTDVDPFIEAEDEKKMLEKYMEATYTSPIQIGLGLACMAVMTLGTYYALFVLGAEPSSLTPIKLLFWFGWVSFEGFVYGMAFWIFGGTVWVLSSMGRKFRLNVIPLHDDEMGGLKPIGELSLLTSEMWALTFGLGLLAFLFNYFHMPVVFSDRFSLALSILSLAVSFLTTLIFFILPVMAIHRALISAKKKELGEIRLKIRSEYDTSREKSTVGESLHSLVNMMSLTYIADELDEMKEWPFDARALRQFVLTALIPIIGVILDFAIRLL